MTETAVLSIDLELFDQTPAYRNAPGEADDRGVGLDAVEYLLDALDERDATATFFVVSSVAERHPDVIRSIAAAGHEIASHTHSHRLLSTLPDDDRRTELERSREVLERVTGRTVSGIRAPAFDLPPGYFEDVAAAGYAYDSSVVPSRAVPGWYGGEHDVHRPASADRIRRDAPATLAELPVSVMPLLRLPLSGTWLRFFGPGYAIAGMELLARRGVTPVLYVHPWELVELPAVDGVPGRVYWRTGRWMRRAVERLLARPFEFVAAGTVVDEADATDGRQRSTRAPATVDRGTTGGTDHGRDGVDRDARGPSPGEGDVGGRT